MTELRNNREAVLDYLNSLAEDELLEVHRQYCENCNYFDDEIYYNGEEFFEMFFDGKTDEAVRAVCYGEFEYMDKYVQFNGYANLVSFNYLKDELDLDEIADNILDEPENYNIDLD